MYNFSTYADKKMTNKNHVMYKRQRGRDITPRGRVFDALENKDYKFRTIQGVVKATGLTEPEVVEVLLMAKSDIVTAYRKSSSGESLITTRKHYREKSTLTEKVIGAVINRVY